MEDFKEQCKNDINKILQKESDILNKLGRDDQKLDISIGDINRKLEQLFTSINEIRVELSSSRINYDHVSSDLKVKSGSLDIHEREIQDLRMKMVNLTHDIQNNTKVDTGLSERMIEVNEKIGLIREEVEAIKKDVLYGRHIIKIVEKVVLTIVGGLGLLLTIQQIFFSGIKF